MNQHSCRCDHSPDLIDNNPVTPSYDFDNPIYHAEEEGEEDCDLLELARLLKQEEKVIQPHEEQVEIENLGTQEVSKEIKVGAALEVNVKSMLISSPGLIKICQGWIPISLCTSYH